MERNRIGFAAFDASSGVCTIDGKMNQAKGSNLWVLAFDKATGERVDFVCCPKGQVAGREMLFKMDGYRVEVMTDDEPDVYIASGGK